MSISSFKDLKIWEKGIELVEKIYLSTISFPAEERFGLTSQMRRASISIPSNIAEGFTRKSGTEYIQFLYISLGSCAEVVTQLTIASKLGFLAGNKSEQLIEEIEILSKMIMSLIKKLKTKD